MLQARSEIGDLEGLSINLGKKLPCEMRGTLEIGVFVAIANDLILILRGKGLPAVINGNEAEMDKTGLERQKEKVTEENQRCLIEKTQLFLRFPKLIIMVATDEVIGNFY